MKGPDQEYLQQLKSKNDLVDVIGGYLPLEKKGANYWACCPFHHEKTPSFSVNAADQYYHCFGCGASGDVITFIREMESVDFMDAVRILAERAKMPLPQTDYDSEEAARAKKKRDEVLRLLRDTAHFYLDALNGGHADKHIAYILKRGISASVVRKFGLGASLNFRDLPRYLLSKGYSEQTMLESGAVAKSERGELIDALGGRLIFPVINAMGDVVAFGGRMLEKTDFAKYKNTKETIVFNKSKNLYNINLVKKQKKAGGLSDIIIVEGYMDAISLYQAGFENVVASMGTALTKEQARLAKRYADTVLISYDGDFAGQKGAIRGLEILREEQLNVRVVPLPEGLDPDDVIKRQGQEGYRACLDAAMPLVDFKLEALARRFDLKNVEQRREYTAQALKVIAGEESASVREDLLKQLRDRTGTTYESLRRDLENAPQAPAPKAEAESRPREDNADGLRKACRFLIASVLFGAKYAEGFDLAGISFEDPVHTAIAEYILLRQKNGERVRPSALFEFIAEDSPELSQILDLSMGDTLEGERAKRYFDDCVNLLERTKISAELEAVSARYDAETDLAERKKLSRRILELTLKLKKLNETTGAKAK